MKPIRRRAPGARKEHESGEHHVPGEHHGEDAPLAPRKVVPPPRPEPRNKPNSPARTRRGR